MGRPPVKRGVLVPEMRRAVILPKVMEVYNKKWLQGKVAAVPKRYVGGQQPVGDQSGLRQNLWTGYSLRF